MSFKKMNPFLLAFLGAVITWLCFALFCTLFNQDSYGEALLRADTIVFAAVMFVINLVSGLRSRKKNR